MFLTDFRASKLLAEAQGLKLKVKLKLKRLLQTEKRPQY
jgi:hypothetical protein